MDARLIVWSGVLQGAGSGFVFLPLTTMAFATVDPKLRTDATGFFNLARNIGASLGISLLITAHTRFAQIAYARLTEAASLDNPLIRAAAGQGGYDLASPDSLAALGGEIARQAAIVAYAQVFQLLLPCSLAMVPLVLFMRRGVPPATGRS
jgi:DHA2 family multidrug resistance protein